MHQDQIEQDETDAACNTNERCIGTRNVRGHLKDVDNEDDGKIILKTDHTEAESGYSVTQLHAVTHPRFISSTD